MAIFLIPSTAVGNAATRTARTAVADKQIQDLMHPADPNPALTAAYGQYQQSRIGQRYKMGRGANRGQIVNRGGEFAGRTPDETLGAIYNKSNPTPGSGPGGGLRTGSIQSGASQASGIDWLKANRTTGPELAAQERAVAPKMTPVAGQPQPAFKPAPQSNFEAAKAAGQVTPDKIAQATAFGARFGQKFDPNTGYSPMGAQSTTTPAAPMPAPIVPNQSQAIAPVAAPVAPKPALTTGGLTTGSLSAPAAPSTDNGVFNRLATNQAAQTRATAPVAIQSGAFQNQSMASAKPPSLTTEESSAKNWFSQQPTPVGASGPVGGAGTPAATPPATPAMSKYEQSASAVTPGAYQKPAAPAQAQQETLDAFNKRQAAYEAKRQQELAFLKDPRYSGRAGQQGRTTAVSAYEKDNPRPVFAKGGRGFNQR